MSAVKQTGAVLWMHDTGEVNAREFADRAQGYAPWLGFNCPFADRRQVGWADELTTCWFEQAHLTVHGGAEEEPPDLGKTILVIHERLEYLESTMMLLPKRIVVAGFGQGGALAIVAGLTYNKKLGGILSHSGWLCQGPERGVIARSPNASTTVMLLHGKDDETVDHSAAVAAVAALKEAGSTDVILQSFEGLGHQMSQQTLGRTVDFFRGSLPAVKPPDKDGTSTNGAAAPAKAKTVVKIGGRRVEPAVPKPAPPETRVPTAYAKPPPPIPLDPVVLPAPTVAPHKNAMALPKQEPQRAAGGAAGTLSPDPATAAALGAGDVEALRIALAVRGDSIPLDPDEMGAIAQLMLGGALDNNDLGKVAEGLVSRAGPPGGVAAQTELDSDDEGDDDGATDSMHSGAGTDAAADAVEAVRVAGAARAAEAVQVAQAQQAVRAQRVVATARAAEATKKVEAARGMEAADQTVNASYTVNELAERLELVVTLPGVASLAELDLEISTDRVCAHINGVAVLKLELPRRIDDAKATAKFSKKRGVLHLVAPYA